MNRHQDSISNWNDLRFLVVGCGSIGNRHLGNLRSMGIDDIIAVDLDIDRRTAVSSQYGIETYSDLNSALNRSPDAVLICTPNSFHMENAVEAAKAGCHLFIEKPLSHSLKGIEELMAEVEQKGLVTLIGCNFKFHPSFIKMKEILDAGIMGRILSARCQFGQYLPDWHPWEDYRKTYSARSDLGGGILLDSHEFNYMQWFLGDVASVFCLSSRISDLDIDTEDTAEVLLKYSSGALAEIHLDYTQRAYQRNYEFFGERGTLKWDHGDRKVWLYRAEDEKWDVFDEPKNYDFNDMYKAEMAHFAERIESRQKTITDIYSGNRVLEIIMAAKESARDGCLKVLAEKM